MIILSVLTLLGGNTSWWRTFARYCCTRSRVKPAAQLGWLFPRNIVPGHVAMSSRFNLQCLMQKLLSRGEFANMEICCQGNTYNVHRAIVCTQSEYFKKAMCDGFKVRKLVARGLSKRSIISGKRNRSRETARRRPHHH